MSHLLKSETVRQTHRDEFLETEVFPAITAKYRVLQGRDNTANQGASYSGIAALYALVHRPDLFGSGIVQNPSLRAGNGQFLRDTVRLVAGPTRVAVDTAFHMPEGTRGSVHGRPGTKS